jgi:hypothetical protein
MLCESIYIRSKNYPCTLGIHVCYINYISMKLLKIPYGCWVPVAHTCNASYSGGREQEDQGSKSVQANSSQHPILKKPITKKGWWSGSRCRPWVWVSVLKINKYINKWQHVQIILKCKKIFFFFGSTGDWTQGLELTRQMFYHLSHIPVLLVF